jgi:hypothetical protein
MERSFFSLAKRKRLKPIEYTSPDGTIYVKVYAMPERDSTQRLQQARADVRGSGRGAQAISKRRRAKDDRPASRDNADESIGPAQRVTHDAKNITRDQSRVMGARKPHMGVEIPCPTRPCPPG